MDFKMTTKELMLKTNLENEMETIKTIVTEEEYHFIEDIQSNCKAAIKDIEENINPEIKQANGLWKSLLAKKKEAVAPFEELKEKTSLMMGAYQKLIREEERREHDRLQAIAVEKQKEQARLDAIQLAIAGEAEAAQSALTHVAPAPEIEVPDFKPTNFGTTTRTTYSIEITDATKVPKQYLCPDEKAILAAVRKSKGTIPIEGVKIIETTKTHAK